MANIKDCLGFETFGADVKEARKVKQLSRKTLAEQVNIDWRYLANLENDDTIPSLIWNEMYIDIMVKLMVQYIL